MPNKSWLEAWADMLIDYIWADAELKNLMLIKSTDTIIDFRNRWFIKAGTSTTPLTDEKIRIVWGNYRAWEQADGHVNKREVSFDIYVKNSELYNATDNRMLSRTELIAQRLRHILTHGDRYLSEAFRFWWVGESDLVCSTTGYSRYNISFNYFITG